MPHGVLVINVVSCGIALDMSQTEGASLPYSKAAAAAALGPGAPLPEKQPPAGECHQAATGGSLEAEAEAKQLLDKRISPGGQVTEARPQVKVTAQQRSAPMEHSDR